MTPFSLAQFTGAYEDVKAVELKFCFVNFKINDLIFVR